MIKSVLIANRGEIVVRVARTLRRMNIRSIGIYSSVDCNSLHVGECDHAVQLEGDQQADLYLQSDLIFRIAKEEGVDAIFPGYGFLSENSQFALDCEREGFIFIGPTAEQIHRLGLKHLAYQMAAEAQLPLLEHSDVLRDLEDAKREAQRVGYPVMLKCSAGGGGNGMHKCSDADQLTEFFEKVQRTSEKLYRDQSIYLEHAIDNGKHLEIQIFGDGQGEVVAFQERDCSMQRRNQKIMEETPASFVSEQIKEELRQAAMRLARLAKYRSAGTVEFIYDIDREKFYFLEVNCRLQVEHTITEMIYQIDLVQWMIQLAAGQTPPEMFSPLVPNGHAIQLRLCSEEPLQNFKPSAGLLHQVQFPSDVRIDTFVQNNIQITPFYDSLLAKVIVHAPTRFETIEILQKTLEQIQLLGINTNLRFFKHLIRQEDYLHGNLSLSYLAKDSLYQYDALEIIEAGAYTSIQDYPGRIGYWNVGVPPSGPMDDYAFRLGNRLVGNASSAAGLECTFTGPTIRFHSSTWIAITGAQCHATINEQAIDLWKAVEVNKGDLLRVDRVQRGCRIYLSIRGGIDVPLYLGSRSTFVLGKFGGYAGRTLTNGDVLYIDQLIDANLPIHSSIPQQILPNYPANAEEHWKVAVLYGPHGAPDFFAEEYLQTFFATKWKVQHNSNRLGVRLIGPKPLWTRSDGGEAGLHPSNIHDCEYAIGSINFTGDTPVILTNDGPSLGGFVCLVTIAKAELWKIGQVKPNDVIQFYPISFDQAKELHLNQIQQISTLQAVPTDLRALSISSLKCLLYQIPAKDNCPLVVYRQAGDNYILIEYGPMKIDLSYRIRVHLLIDYLKAQNRFGQIEEYSPGVRSLQIKYNSLKIDQKQLLVLLISAEEQLNENIDQLQIPSRIIHLPFTFEDSQTLQAVERYQQTVRENAPWLPNNVDFMQRINGLDSREEVKKIVFDATYLVLGLGDVYLGAPCAVPLDPRHRLLTSKYNPARTFTPEGTVGIGGVYMCIYGMDSPGGYQLIGKTVPIWNTFVQNKDFKENSPWLLRFFDQVKFYPVEEEELHRQRHLFSQGKFHLQIDEENLFNFKEYQQFLQDNSPSIESFLQKQNKAFQEEVSLWKNQIEETPPKEEEEEDSAFDQASLHLEDLLSIKSDVCGTIWKILVQLDEIVQQDAPILILEAMKMEIILRSPIQGRINHILCHLGQLIDTRNTLITIKSL